MFKTGHQADTRTKLSGLYITLISTADEYIYIDEDSHSYDEANQRCQDRGYLHLAVVNTEVQLGLFSIAMEMEYK